MLDWNDYINELVKKPLELDDIIIKYDCVESHITPIIKSSIQILERIIEIRSHYNIFVFPEIQHLGFELCLYKVIYNVYLGKIKMSYDPHSFKKGELLQYRKCTVEFDSCKLDDDNIERIYFYVREGLSKTKHGLPITKAPYFQKSNAKHISTNQAYAKAINSSKTDLPSILDNMKNNRTHLNGSIFLIGTIKKIRELINDVELNGSHISDVFYIGQANGDGNITNVYSGKLKGNPAIVIASDLYSVINSIERGAKIQSLIIDISQHNTIEKQLDAFDELHNYNFPILCITDTKNSFDLNQLLIRNYNLWRWDNTNITTTVQISNSLIVKEKMANCSKQTINYYNYECNEISDSFTLLYKNRNSLDDSSSNFNSIFYKLFSLSFMLLRNVIPLSQEVKNHNQEMLEECTTLLNGEERFITNEHFEDIKKIISSLKLALAGDFSNPKAAKIKKILESKKYHQICIIVHEAQDKVACQKYWQDFCIRRHKPVKITVQYPQEYRSSLSFTYDLTIIVGWLNNRSMRNVIYSFNSPNYSVLTYPCEDVWRKSHVRSWDSQLNQSCNQSIIDDLLGNESLQAAVIPKKYVEETSNEELENIDELFSKTKYCKYSSQKGNESVEVYPVSFVGGSMAFYRLGHKIITVTKIIQSVSDEIESLMPDELQIGNFVLIRETEHDIIRDLADKLLEKSGQSKLRDTASKWKESLKIESLFSSIEDIYDRLKEVGCSKEFQTVKNWITNDQLIIPQKKDDLIYIAKATDDKVLEEKIDEIFEAGEIIKKIHIKAGRILSQRLRQIIVDKIKEVDDIDPYNIWEPFTIQIEDIGTVKILKVIDKGDIISVDSGITNRLIYE